ncbi:hypothetical protein SNOG_03879 [Parastagonospora nodorum SN15]|uniref:Uncharacterized protein n=1 Tax=Phaeosphaeria nodorum (strain SN15 / ATCC MYA-4574 / FGSC 10173) TaxID=321614 RepID=Q0UWI5_PHANO|nr:hypothetical protein SNOG_03879 [Parastagonospora nodorum SN15]EAT89084.1 hypothetical protein SNOG_03879 [Parastagonospora nodorum SN15]
MSVQHPHAVYPARMLSDARRGAQDPGFDV